MSRKDYRTNQQFEQDIYFSTKIEGFLWKTFCERVLKNNTYITENYGVDNSGKVVAKSSSNADYRLKLTIDNTLYDLLLEIKFGPNSNKLTFKVQDLKAYITQNANILLFYNTGKVNLKKPQNYNIEEHIKLIENNLKYIKYTILSPDILQTILDTYVHEKIYYMGNKLSIIVPAIDYSKLFTERQL